MNQIFREKSLKRVQSPEQLDEIVEVNKPYVWLVLVAALVLLGGFFVWAIFGVIPTKVAANVLVNDGVGSIYLNVDKKEGIAVGTKIVIGGKEFVVKTVADKPISAEQVGELIDDKYTLEQINPTNWSIVITFDVTGIKNGVHKADIIVSETKAIAFLFN